jgi:hypothetical protein
MYLAAVPKKFVFRAGVVLCFAVSVAIAQDDITTQNASSAWSGGWITGPASNPLSLLNGPLYRSIGTPAPYDLRDFRPASWVDELLPRWLSIGVEERIRFEGYHDGGLKPRNDDSYGLNRFRFQMNLSLRPWLKLVAQLQDSRPFLEKPPLGPPNGNRWDLKLAYVQLGDPKEHWISVRVGRQMINYNNTLIANSDWRNQGRSFDAVVTNLRYRNYRLGVFAGSVVVPQFSGISHHKEGNNIYGLYGNIDDIIPRSALEPFVLWRVQRTTAGIKMNEKIYGYRFKGRGFPRLDYSVEVVLEDGTAGSGKIRAWAATTGAGYRLEAVPWRPRFFGQYDFASGNGPEARTRGTFDTVYPTAHDRLGILDLFGWQNIKSLRGGLTLRPRRRWTVTTQYLNFNLASTSDALYDSSGAVLVRDTGGHSGTHIGDEADIYSWYELNAHVNIGGGFGRLMPGGFLSKNVKGPGYCGRYFGINFRDKGSAHE